MSQHSEPHYSNRNNWLRATVLGANDGLISTSSLLMGMAAATPSQQTVLLAGLAAVVGGTISMAAGEYVSVSSQADTERSDLNKEIHELTHNPDLELDELTAIYCERGLNPDLAKEVAQALTAHNALQAHARDEIGITETLAAKPFQAAIASAAAFMAGALPPLLAAYLAPVQSLVWILVFTALSGLGILGALSARLGGAPIFPAVRRVLVWGTAALAATALIGHWFGVAV